MRLWLASVLLITNLTFFQPQNSATPAIEFSALAAEYSFGEKITFTVTVSHPE